jgi:hypothetical protein
MRRICFLLIFLLPFLVPAQDVRFTISGYVKEAASGESLFGAIVALKELQKGIQTNQYGFYSITVTSGKYTLTVSYLGFTQQSFEINLDKDLRLNVAMEPLLQQTGEVVISGEREDRNVSGTQMGRDQLEVEQIKKLPAFLGEVDILKTIQLLPGVQSGGEGNSGYYVRGGSLDQNLILPPSRSIPTRPGRWRAIRSASSRS